MRKVEDSIHKAQYHETQPDPEPKTDDPVVDQDRDSATELQPGMEPLTPEEKEAFLARVRAQGRSLTSAEQYAIFGPPPEVQKSSGMVEQVEDMAPADLDAEEIDRLQTNFFPELGDPCILPRLPLVQGIIFDFDDTLAYLARPRTELLEEGAKNAEAYMRSTGMTLPPDFWTSIMEARLFAEEKSEEEQEEHIADDAMSFLLQFYGYPASKMDREVLKHAVDVFYAPEMTAWKLFPGVLDTLQTLRNAHYKLAVIANYNCDRVFQRTVDYLGLRPYLDFSLASASIEYRKPDETIFNIVLESWDALPYEVVIVGDSLLHDIKGGIDLGALTVHALMGSSAQVEHTNMQFADDITPDAIIHDLTQLPELIFTWTEQ